MPLPIFATAEPLTATDANTLARQGVITVATTTARDALPGPHEGMVVFVEADKTYCVRVDGAWVVVWQPPSSEEVPLRAGFTNNVDLVVIRDGDLVTAQGRVSGTFTTGNVIIGDVPPGFRPGTTERPALTFNTTAAVTGSAAILSTGEINVSASTAGAHIVNIYTSWRAA